MIPSAKSGHAGKKFNDRAPMPIAIVLLLHFPETFKRAVIEKIRERERESKHKEYTCFGN